MKKHDRNDAASAEVTQQFAALCYRVTKKRGCQILLVTSRDTGRWVPPKGWPMKGRTGAECALQEAFEEAGVEGKVAAEAVGLYSYDKGMDDGSLQPCVVTVYPVRVDRLRGNFPERKERARRWFSPKHASRKVAEPELQAMLADFAPPSAETGNGGNA